MIENGWIRASIDLRQGMLDEKAFFRCPPELMDNLFHLVGALSTLITIQSFFNSDVQRTFRRPWDSTLLDSYCEAYPVGHVVLLDSYSDATVMSKSATHST